MNSDLFTFTQRPSFPSFPAGVTEMDSLATFCYGLASVGRQARTYINQLSVDTGCRQEDQPRATDCEKESDNILMSVRLDDDGLFLLHSYNFLKTRMSNTFKWKKRTCRFYLFK